MQPFLEAWSRTGREEAGYVNHPNDSGGATNWGITERVARAHGFMGDMRDLPRERAREIAKASYWDLLRLDDIAALSRPVAFECFDSGFLCGQGTVAGWLQRLINVLNRGGKDYPDIAVDHLIGPMTIFSLRAYLAFRGRDGETALLAGLNALQGCYHVSDAERRPKDEAFVFGWLLNRVAR